MADNFSPAHVNTIRDLITEIESLRYGIKARLERDPALVAEAFKIEPVHYASKYPTHIPVSPASKIEALNSFNIQQTDVDGERSPRRTFGVIKVSMNTYRDVGELVKSHNDKITYLKNWLAANFTTSHARSRHIHAAMPNIIIPTLYRTIKLAPETCYRVSYDWNNNQKAPIRIDLNDIGKIVESYGDVYEDGSVSLTAQEAGEQAMYRLGEAPIGYEYVQLKSIKVHPQQIYYHRTPAEGKKTYRGRVGVYRETLKANNCLIVPMQRGVKLKHQEPSDFAHKNKAGISGHYTPVNESLGIYMRLKSNK